MKFEKYCRLREAKEKVFELDNNAVKVEQIDNLTIPEIVNMYHYNFFSRKNFKTPFFSLFVNLILSIICVCLIRLSFISIETTFFLYWILLFFVSTLIWVLNVFNTENNISVQRINRFIKYLSRKSQNSFKIYYALTKNISKKSVEKDKKLKMINWTKCHSVIYILRLENKRYTEEIIRNWLVYKFKDHDLLSLSEDLIKWRSITSDNKDVTEINIKEFIYDKSVKSNIAGYIVAFFALVATVLINVVSEDDLSLYFFELFNVKYIHLYVACVLLTISIIFVCKMIIYLCVEIANIFFEFIYDKFNIDKYPNELRFRRFIYALTYYHTVDVQVNNNILDDESEN